VNLMARIVVDDSIYIRCCARRIELGLDPEQRIIGAEPPTLCQIPSDSKLSAVSLRPKMIPEIDRYHPVRKRERFEARNVRFIVPHVTVTIIKRRQIQRELTARLDAIPGFIGK